MRMKKVPHKDAILKAILELNQDGIDAYKYKIIRKSGIDYYTGDGIIRMLLANEYIRKTDRFYILTDKGIDRTIDYDMLAEKEQEDI